MMKKELITNHWGVNNYMTPPHTEHKFQGGVPQNYHNLYQIWSSQRCVPFDDLCFFSLVSSPIFWRNPSPLRTYEDMNVTSIISTPPISCRFSCPRCILSRIHVRRRGHDRQRSCHHVGLPKKLATEIVAHLFHIETLAKGGERLNICRNFQEQIVLPH